ncbi:dienelactone hydrolase family protein, partial [Mycolicibacterium gadium]|uniref:dienelactone hydrolase family protein n=1 Tax=Mycolicibacterium gadium TaxID=1794 RepID=UPI0021F27D83
MPGPEADLTGWVGEPFTAAGITHDVYRKGEGPGVVLIPEIPGVHPGVLALGNYLVDNGFTVAIPSLFGTPEAPSMTPAMVPVLARACVAREFAAFATNKDRPVSHYLRALARDVKEKSGSKGVGVIGQCFSGGFALAAAVDDSVLASVLSQPSVPIGLTPSADRVDAQAEARPR